MGGTVAEGLGEGDEVAHDLQDDGRTLSQQTTVSLAGHLEHKLQTSLKVSLLGAKDA